MTRHRALALAAMAGVSLAPLAAQAQQAAGGSSTTVSEVVITAQKRAEKLVNVPVVVTAVSGQRLEQAAINNVQDLNQVAPGLHIDSSGSYLMPSIRGVGSAVAGSGASANVPIYIDGFYQPSDAANGNLDFVDIDSVQVLKGPQGTLFGRNATGGAIVITTKTPSFTPHVDANVGYGSWNEARAQFYATTGLTSDLAGSVTLSGDRSDGWVKNVVSNKIYDRNSNYSIKLRLLYTPTDWAKFTLTAYYGHASDPTLQLTNCHNLWCPDIAIPGTVVTQSRGEVSNSNAVWNKNSQQGVNLKSEFDLGFARLTSYSGIQSNSGYQAIDLDSTSAHGLGASWHIAESNYSQEFDLNSKPGGPLDWVTGVFFFHERDGDPWFDLNIGDGPYFLLWTAEETANSWAVFGDATYRIGKFHLTLGARGGGDQATEAYTMPSSPVPQPERTWNSFTPRAVVRYEVTDDSNVYVSWSKGTKAGLFNPDGQSATPVNPESITDWEGGYKIDRHSWQLEASGFHYDYKNLQVAAYDGTVQILQNAPGAEIYGAELHFADRLTDELRLDMGGAWTHARYGTFTNAAVFTWCPNAATPGCATAGPAFPTIYVPAGGANVSGGQMERTPEFTGYVSLDYSRPYRGGKLDLDANYNFQTKSYFDLNAYQGQPAYGVLNLHAAWTTPSGRWTFEADGKNVTDTAYLVQITEQALNFGQIYGAPASFFLEVKYHY